MTARRIDTGNGISVATHTVGEIAAERACRLDTWSDRLLFMDTFARVRVIGPELAPRPLDLETVCVELTRNSSVMQAAMIEALASLRAEGVVV